MTQKTSFNTRHSPNGESDPSLESSASSLLSTLSRRDATCGIIRCDPNNKNGSSISPCHPRFKLRRSSLRRSSLNKFKYKNIFIN